jgi:hypothetical protein
MEKTNNPTELDYYFIRKIRPKPVQIYVHKEPKYLKNYLADKDNFCSVHGLHNDWLYSPNKKFGKYTYSVMRCRKCSSLVSRYWHFTHPIKAMLKDAKKHSRTFDTKFDLRHMDIFSKLKEQDNKCVYSGRKFESFFCRPSLDQKVARLGYTLDNIQILEKNVNIMKSNFEENYFLDLVELVFNFRVNSSGKYGQKDLLYQTGIDVKDSQYVKDRVDQFNAGLPVVCSQHGPHRDWEISFRKDKPKIRCRLCKKEELRISREKKKMGEISYSEKLTLKIQEFINTGLASCEKHGVHPEFKLRTKGRRLDCKLCVQEKRDEYYSQYPLKAIFLARRSAIKTKKKYLSREFSITYDDLEAIYENQNGRCWYSNVVLKKEIMGGISMDRLDNSVGYTKENVCLAFADINRMKSDLDFSEFMTLIKEIYGYKIHE